MTLGWEKRAARRVPIHCPVQILVASGQSYGGMALDLSVDGILFDSPIALEPAQSAELHLQPPPGSMITPLRAAIEVIRCDALPHSTQFRIAAALRALPD